MSGAFTALQRRPRPSMRLLRSSLLSLSLLPGCAGLPEFTPGVTRRVDVLLALGEPVLALDDDTVLVHAWTPSLYLTMIPARTYYRRDASGVLRRAGVVDAVAIGDPPVQAQPGQRATDGRHVVHEFDAHGVLLRRLP
jgi:hypothetical protein